MHEDKERHLAFDGSSTRRGGGSEVILGDPDDTNVSSSFKLDFLALIAKVNTSL